jgi:hypothetical protein
MLTSCLDCRDSRISKFFHSTLNLLRLTCAPGQQREARQSKGWPSADQKLRAGKGAFQKPKSATHRVRLEFCFRLICNPEYELDTNEAIKERAMFSNIDPLKILQLGVIGLGFLLAVLAYFLLREVVRAAMQPDAVVNNSILKAIYVFEGFSIILVVLGLAAQVLKPRPDCSTFASQLSAIQRDIATMASNESDSLASMKADRDAHRVTEEKEISEHVVTAHAAEVYANQMDAQIKDTEQGFKDRLTHAAGTVDDAIHACAR